MKLAILAEGFGTRFEILLKRKQKLLLDINGQPFIKILLKKLDHNIRMIRIFDCEKKCNSILTRNYFPEF